MKVEFKQVRDVIIGGNVILSECKNKDEAFDWLAEKLRPYDIEILEISQLDTGNYLVRTGAYNIPFNIERRFIYDVKRHILVGA